MYLFLKITFVIAVCMVHAQVQVHKVACEPVPKTYCYLHAELCPSQMVSQHLAMEATTTSKWRSCFRVTMLHGTCGLSFYVCV